MVTDNFPNDSLERISSEIIGCPLCKLSRNRKNAVPGEGQISAKLIFIGEAPGKNEDEKGKPFVGAAGSILSTAMEKAGITRSEVFITNRVKCRPPGNQVPEECEQTHVGRILKGKFKFSLISPKIICSLASI
jgi:uracil-DNA glycosylase family 4